MRMNNKKGFTLIELLAVIVILAVIIIIAVPSVLGIIQESKIKTFNSNAKLIIRAVELERVKNSNLNLAEITPETMPEILNMPGDNYADLNVSLENDQVKIVAVGQNDLAGLIASGTKENITIVKSKDYILPIITINGSNPTIIEKGGTYTELNATATDNNDGDVSANITKTGSVDTNVVGTYMITYSVSNTSGNTATATRTVRVIDITLPAVAFESNGNNSYAKSRSTKVTVSDVSGINSSSLKYQWLTSTVEPTVDSFSSGFTNEQVISTLTDLTGDYYLWILSKDNLNNASITSSNVFKLDNTKPVITLTGDSTVNITKDTVYTDSGATAEDNIDGTITNNIITASTVVPSIVGEYTVTYNVTDSSGNVADTITRTVNVIQPFVVFGKTYGGTGTDTFNDIIAISDGYIAVGNSNSTNGDLTGLNKGDVDAIIVKYDLTGNVVWKKNYGGTLSDNFKAITATAANDGYVVVGESSSTNTDLSGLNKGSSDAIIVKFDLNGNVVWKKNFGSTGFEYFNDIITITNGYITVGNSNSTTGDLSGLNKGSYDGIIVKYDLTGAVVWKKNFGGTDFDSFVDVVMSSDGYAISGFTQSTNGDVTGLSRGPADTIVVKYDFNGNLVWNKNFGGTKQDGAFDIILATDGYVVAGYSTSTDVDLTGLNKGLYDAILVKYDFTGNVVWKKNFGGASNDIYNGIRPITNGYMAVGYSNSTDGELAGLNKGSDDNIVVKLDSNGDVIWNKNIGGSGSDYFNNLVTVADGFVAVGKSPSTDGDLTGLNKGGQDAIIFKLSNN